jgi:hypothetical protein
VEGALASLQGIWDERACPVLCGNEGGSRKDRMFLRLEPGSWMVVRVVDLTQSDEVVEVSSETCCSALFIKDGGIEGRSLIFLQRYDMWDGGASLGVEG